jgi:hypothetical protein
MKPNKIKIRELEEKEEAEEAEEDEDRSLILATRHELFPRLNPVKSETPVPDVLPTISHVRKMILVNMPISEVALEVPDEFSQEFSGSDDDDDDLEYELEDGEAGGEVSADSPYRANEGLKAVRSIEGRAGGEGEGEEEEGEYEYDDDEEEEGEGGEGVEKDSDYEYQRSIEKTEKEAMEKAARQELWYLREGALEEELAKEVESKEAELRDRALKFALPELAHFNTKPLLENMMNRSKPQHQQKRNQNDSQNSFKK